MVAGARFESCLLRIRRAKKWYQRPDLRGWNEVRLRCQAVATNAHEYYRDLRVAHGQHSVTKDAAGTIGYRDAAPVNARVHGLPAARAHKAK